MTSIVSENIDLEILDKVSKIEKRIQAIEAKLSFEKESDKFFRFGLRAYTKYYMKLVGVSHSNGVIAKWSQRMRSDKEIGLSHRKILGFFCRNMSIRINALVKLFFLNCAKNLR